MCKQAEIAVGNIVGSNIFGILGTTALIAHIPDDPRFASADMPWVAGTVIGLGLIAMLMGGLPRIAGVILMIGYRAYIALI